MYAIPVFHNGAQWEVSTSPQVSYNSEDAPFWEVRMDTQEDPQTVNVLFQGHLVPLPVHVRLDNPQRGYVRSTDLFTMDDAGGTVAP